MRAQSYESMGCEVSCYPVNHRIDRHAAEFDAVGVNVIILGTERLGDFSAACRAAFRAIPRRVQCVSTE